MKAQSMTESKFGRTLNRGVTMALLAVILGGGVGGLGGIGGCETMNSVERAEPIGKKAMVNDKRIQTDYSLGETVKIIGVNEGRTPDGLLKIQVEVLNDRSVTRGFYYKFEWFDASGMVVNSPMTGFTEQQIVGGEQKMLIGIAPKPSAVDFRLKLKED